MSRGGFGNTSSLGVTASQSVQTPSPISSPTQSTSSFSSQETIKASRFSTKAILKELVGGGGNNRSVPKLPKSERVYTSGRGGARKGPKSLSYIGPSNAEKLDALLSNSNREPECLASEIATVSSCAASHSGSLESGHSKVTVKQAVKEVLGGGGNEHDFWKQEPGFIRSYGRGGSYRSPTTPSFTSRTPSDIEILSEGHSDSSSLSVARNAHGLFFFGRGRRSSEDASDTGSFLVVGPGQGIIHPSSANGRTHPSPLSSDSALTRSSMHKSGMSKISVKVAVKEVLGGGGNDDGEWKYIDVFYPGYGRGGEGARLNNSIRDLYDIFYPCPHYSGRHYWYHNPNEHPRARHSSDSTISFPSISSDTSSVYAASMSSGRTSGMSSTGEDEEDTCSSWSIAQAYLARPNDYLLDLAHHDLATPNRLLEDDTAEHQPGPAYFLGSLVPNQYQASFAENGRGRAMSEGAEAVHSPQLVHFRRSLQAERQRKGGSRVAERTLRERVPGTKQGMPAEPLTGRPLGHVPPPPSHWPPSLPPPASIRYSYKGSSGRPADRGTAVLPTQLPPPTLPEIELEQDLRLHAVGRSLASALALVQARSEHIRNMETPVTQLGREHEELRREREMLAARLQSMKKEILQHEKTIEGLTWLVSNLPEHQGRQIVVDTGDSEIDEATMLMIREAEEELMNGDSRSILNLERCPDSEEPALPDSPRGVGPVL
ncbi:hypothetical protein FS837_003199 [Tulasnella sp. UAMH 9824]|nr:hypothetical protein FS837_003199 [Tulasnella sp. UAMH 9824]